MDFSKKRFVFSTLCLVLGIASLLPHAQGEDISSSPYSTSLQAMVNERIMTGYPDGSLKPDQEVNRAELLKIALGMQSDFSLKEAQMCLENKSALKWTTVYFRDVSMQAWYAPYVCYAYENKMISGYSDGTFRPGNTVNIAEMSKFIIRVMGGEQANTRAVSSGESWYIPYLEIMEEWKAIVPTVKYPWSKARRGEVAETVYRIHRHPETKEGMYKTMADIQAVPVLNTPKETIGKIQSCAELNQRLYRVGFYGAIATPMPYMMKRESVQTFGVSSPVAAPTAGSGAMEDASVATNDISADSYSKTNIQVEGVDEADIVKNDGKYIYIVKGNGVRIVEAYPSNAMKELGMVTFTDKEFTPQELYINGNQLIVVGVSYQNSYDIMPMVSTSRMIAPYPRSTQMVKVALVNIQEKTAPKVERVVGFEGNYTQSRRIGGVLYLVTTHQPDVYSMIQNRTPIEDVLPKMIDKTTTEQEYKTSCSGITYFPGFEQAQYLTVAGIPLDDKVKAVTRQTFLGSSENIYMSTKALYIATGFYDDTKIGWNTINTQVYKFGIEGLLLTFKGTKKVPGRIINQFAMDEYADYFRIATTKDGDSALQTKSTNNLYVLDSAMQQVGSVEDLAPGEKIYSTRFMGKRAYMVTFKTVDPLFVLDLTTPSQPKVLGQLKIPGWSDYLHPYDENHVIGFGKEVDEALSQKILTNPDLVHYTAIQGMKMSMFDVTDPTQPKEMFKEIIGTRGTDSEVLHNHKALLFDKEKNLLAFPITLYAERTQSTGTILNEWEKYYPATYGAMVYTVDLQKGFTKRGLISHVTEKEPTVDMYSYYPAYESMISRILYIGDSLYTISQQMVKASDIMTTIEKSKLELK